MPCFIFSARFVQIAYSIIDSKAQFNNDLEPLAAGKTGYSASKESRQIDGRQPRAAFCFRVGRDLEFRRRHFSTHLHAAAAPISTAEIARVRSVFNRSLAGGLHRDAPGPQNVSVELSLPLKSLGQPLRDSIRELRLGYQPVSECLEQTMAECDLRVAELGDCRRQLAQARESLSECEKQVAERNGVEADLANQCGTLQKALESKQTELAQAADQFAHAQAASTQANERLEIQIEQNQQLRQQVARAESDREALRGDVAQLRAQFGPLAESVTEAARLRGELASAQAESMRLRDQLVASPSDALLQEQQAAVLQRRQLESELDALRHRGAELFEALAEQKQAATQEREQWNEELRQLRRAVERQSEVLARRGSQSPAAGPSPEQLPARPSNEAKEDDKVVDSVLAQFETLQRNKVRKLANTPG